MWVLIKEVPRVGSESISKRGVFVIRAPEETCCFIGPEALISSASLEPKPPNDQGTRVRQVIREVATTTLIAVSLFGCSTGPDDPFSGLGPIQPTPTELDQSPPSSTSDMGSSGGAGSSMSCVPRQRRCLGENSPLNQICSDSGTSWVASSCQEGQICRDSQCVGFTCVPGRDICVGTNATATCAPGGRSVSEITTCPTNESCRGGACVNLCDEAEASRSYIGCSYAATQLFNEYFTAPPAYTGNSPYAIIAANPDPFLPADITLSAFDGTPLTIAKEVTVRPEPGTSFGEITTVRSEILTPSGATRPLDTTARDVTLSPGEAAIMLLPRQTTAKNYKLQSTSPVVAYQFSPYCCNFTYTNDASLLLPESTLGTSYRVVNYPTMQYRLASGTLFATPYIYIVALENDTEVNVEATVALGVEAGEDYRSDVGFVDGAHTQHTLKLGRGERKILSIPASASAYAAATSDMSGTVITSNKKIAVFAGHPCTFVPSDAPACDHLEEQMVPSDTLGGRHILPAFEARNPEGRAQGITREGTYWRIVAHEDARITLTPSHMEVDIFEPSTFSTPSCLSKLEDGVDIILRAGEVCELGVRESVALDSDAPIIVAGVLSGHQSTGLPVQGSRAGDPSMFLSPPFEQYRRSYSFVTSPTFYETFAAITAPAGTAITLDGLVIQPQQKLEYQQLEVGGQSWETYNIALDAGLNSLSADDAFGVYVYAYDDYVSYAFPAGMDLVPRIKH